MRSVAEWIGRDDDEPVPTRVRLRVYRDKGGKCHRCTRKILIGEAWTCEHVKALINARDGEKLNRESNLDLTCCNCLPAKNAEDLSEKALVYRKKVKHLGLHKPKGRTFQTNRNGEFKQSIGGKVMKRNTIPCRPCNGAGWIDTVGEWGVCPDCDGEGQRI